MRELCEVAEYLADTYRIINDKGQPVLFEPQCFEIVNSTLPDFWITEVGEDAEEYSYPNEWKSLGLGEDYYIKDKA